MREAVKSLETRNILTIKRGAGTFISQNEGVAVDPLGISLMGKDEEMALELLDVRMILEPEVRHWPPFMQIRMRLRRYLGRTGK